MHCLKEFEGHAKLNPTSDLEDLEGACIIHLFLFQTA